MMKPNDDDNAKPVSQELSLDEFRENWQREIRAQNEQNSPVDQQSENNKETTHGSREKQQDLAENLFEKAVELEKKGKVYDALPFYKKAVQILPDIERIFYEREKLNFTASVEGNTLKTVENSAMSDTSDCIEDLDLYEKFKGDLANEEGRLLLSGCNAMVISTRTHISELPPEILFYILRWVVSNQLDIASLENCAKVSKGMYLFARDDELWRSACIQVWGANCGSPDRPGSNDKDSSFKYKSWREMYIERTRVLYNGCYISKTTYLRMGENSFQDQYYRPLQLVEYFRYVRFLPDGTMFMMTSADEPSVGVTKLRNIHQLRPDVLKGHYCLKGNIISCILQKQQTQVRVPLIRPKRNMNAQGDEFGSNKYHIEFKILSTPKRKFSQLIWLHYSITQTRNKIETSSVFEITPSKYPPLWFSPVRSYHLIADAPLI